MVHPSRLRVAAVLAAVAGLALFANPVLAHTTVKQVGTTGSWSLKDTHRRPGARCAYSIYGNLFQISIRPPVVYGAYSSPTWVGWRFRILRSTNAGATWRTIKRSSVHKDRATSSVPADGFARRLWDGPEEVDPPASSWYKVRLVILFYAPGSARTVEGKVVVEDDWYKEKYPTSPAFHHPEYCGDSPD